MSDQPDRQHLRPTVEGRARLLAAIEAVGQPHVVDSGTLGEYAELVAVRGQAEADATLPEVAAHMASGCPACADDVRELVQMTAEPPTPQPPPLRGANIGFDVVRRTIFAGPRPDVPQAEEGEQLGVRKTRGGDSGIYAVDLPDVRAAEAEAARRQLLRRLRDRLLIAAAVAILVMGLSLVGLAYLASSQPGPRISLTPQPSSGRAAPSGMTCPGTHPIKGNRASMIYHAPGGAFYDATRPEYCFAGAADAEAAGYRRSTR